MRPPTLVALAVLLAFAAGATALWLTRPRAAVDPQAALARAAQREAAGDLEGAAAAYESALYADRTAGTARAGLARMRFRQARYAEAVPLLAAVADAQPGAVQPLIDLGTALLRLERNEEAVAALQRAVAADPGSAPACNNLGVALARMGRFDEAAAQFERVLQIDPQHRTAARSLRMARGQVQAR